MNCIRIILILIVASISMVWAQERDVGTLPPGPRGGPIEVIHVLFVQAQMIEDGQVMFCFPRGDQVPSLFAKVDGKAVRALGADLKPLTIAELEQRLPAFTGVVVVQSEFDAPDPFFLKVLDKRSVIFMLPKQMFSPMAKASTSRRAPGDPHP